MTMKKILSMITLTVLMVALAGSCTKNLEERLDKADTDLAGVRTAIGQYEKLQSDITSVIQSLQNEVGGRPASEQQTVWECIAALQSQNNTVSAAISALNALVGEESVSDQIAEALAELTDSYDLDNLEATLQELKAGVAEKFDPELLKSKVAKLSKTVRNFDIYLAKLLEIEGQIQSVSIIPDYDDGSVKIEDGVIELMCVITPASVLSDISNPYEIFTLTLSYGPATKSGESEEIYFDNIEPYDRERGILRFTADISDYIPEDDSQTLTVSINVKFGGTTLTSGLVKVTSVPDIDGDGVPNSIDECPDTPAGVAVDDKGCPLDSDGDGVADYLDKCPGTPLAAQGFVDENGCPTDKDGDGVYDYEDKCPETPGIKENKGCPEIK